jgi:hypothetical protein
MLPTSLFQLTIDLQREAELQNAPYANEGGFAAFVGRILSALMAIGAMSVLIFLVWGAFDWINAGGEKGKIESARNKMTGAIMGLIVLAATLAIFTFVQSALGIEVLEFTGGGAGTGNSRPFVRPGNTL